MRRPVIVLLAAVLLVACAGPTATAPATSAGEPSTESPAATSMPPAASDTGSTAATDLPAECEAAIRQLLIELEPVVSEYSWTGDISEEQLDTVSQLSLEASDAFDPEVCPDVGFEEARAAWIAVATESAPDAIEYVEWVYAEQ